jgi:hypothetical protein
MEEYSKIKGDNESDSGEDFNYGEEDAEEDNGKNIDLLAYISNMDVTNI